MERWRRNFYAIWPSLLAVSLGLMGVIPALPLYIEERFSLATTQDVEWWTAVVFGAAPFTAAVCGPFWGALGDRIGRKAMVLRAHLGITVSLALMPLATDPWSLTGLRVLQGMFAGYIAPAMALVAADVPAHKQGRVIARLQLALALGLALGPPLAAEVSSAFGRGVVFWVGSGLALVSAIPVALFVREDRSRLTGALPASERPQTSIRDVLTDRRLLALLGLIFALRFGLHMTEPFTALWVRELGALAWLASPEGTPAQALERTVAAAFTILAIGQLLMTTTWGRLADRMGPLRCFAVAAIALAGLQAITSMVEAAGSYLVVRSIAALFMAGLMTLAYSSVAKRVDRSRKALAFALVQSCMQFGVSLGPFFGSYVSSVAGLRGLFRTAAVVLVVAGVGMMLLRRVESRRPSHV